MLVATYFCRDKTFVVTNICPDKHKLLSGQDYFCRDKFTFVATNTCFVATNTSFVSTKVSLSRQMFYSGKHTFVAKTRLLSRRKYACRDKTFVVTNISPDKHKLLSRQAYLCRDKITFVAKSLLLSQQIRVLLRQTHLLFPQKYACRDKSFIAASILLSRQKTGFVATKDEFRRDKHVFVATKMILVAAPANDKKGPFPSGRYRQHKWPSVDLSDLLERGNRRVDCPPG